MCTLPRYLGPEMEGSPLLGWSDCAIDGDETLDSSCEGPDSGAPLVVTGTVLHGFSVEVNGTAQHACNSLGQCASHVSLCA